MYVVILAPWPLVHAHCDLDPIPTIHCPLLVLCTPNPATIVVATAAAAGAPAGSVVPSFSVVLVLALDPLD